MSGAEQTDGRKPALGRADVTLVPLRNTAATTYAAWRAGSGPWSSASSTRSASRSGWSSGLLLRAAPAHGLRLGRSPCRVALPPHRRAVYPGRQLGGSMACRPRSQRRLRERRRDPADVEAKGQRDLYGHPSLSRCPLAWTWSFIRPRRLTCCSCGSATGAAASSARVYGLLGWSCRISAGPVSMTVPQ